MLRMGTSSEWSGFYPVPRTGGILCSYRRHHALCSYPVPRTGDIKNGGSGQYFFKVSIQSPAWGDIRIRNQQRKTVGVSIQPPVRGTFIGCFCDASLLVVSIRSPRGGHLVPNEHDRVLASFYPVPRTGALHLRRLPCRVVCFYPVPRAGDIWGGRAWYVQTGVSIQSPVRGTLSKSTIYRALRKFLSSPPCGGHFVHVVAEPPL